MARKNTAKQPYWKVRAERLRAAGACPQCAQVIGSGTKISLRAEKDESDLGPAPEDSPAVEAPQVIEEPAAKPKRSRSREAAA